VRVRVGPVSSAGVGLWIAYARTVIGSSLAHPQDGATTLTPEVVEAFDDYLDQWEQSAGQGPTFVWEADFEPERLALLGGVWLAIAEQLANGAEQRGYPISPPEGDEFYHALIAGFLDALGGEGGDYRQLAADLRSSWPGFKEGEPDPTL
jgi:hypothetical protein